MSQRVPSAVASAWVLSMTPIDATAQRNKPAYWQRFERQHGSSLGT
jgi:hypothetical protein